MIERSIKHAITWWLSAPLDERVAVAIFVTPTLLIPAAIWLLPSLH